LSSLVCVWASLKLVLWCLLPPVYHGSWGQKRHLNPEQSALWKFNGHFMHIV
jgi:hypothetical protein